MALPVLRSVLRTLSSLNLDLNFDDYIDIDYYKEALPVLDNTPTQVPPLPQQPMPNVQASVQPNITQSGLTPVESALLSQEEQLIRLRQRGLA